MEKKRVVYFDILNILATICVVFLHCNGLAYNYTNTLGWKQAMLVETVCYWAVPVFLMLTGATLFEYRKRYSTKEFFIKRIQRTVIPFLIWGLINAVLKEINPFDIGIKTFLSRLLCGSFENIYWFFPVLFSIYLSIPVLSALIDNRKILYYMAGFGFLFTSLIPVLSRQVGIGWPGVDIQVASGYLLFPIIGYLLATEDLDKRKRLIIYLFGIFGVVLRYFGTWILSENDGKINKMFFGYCDYYSVFLAVAVFVFIKYLPLNERISSNKKMCRVLSTVSGLSFGVYLTHMFVIRFLDDIFVVNCWQWRIFAPLCIYFIALVLTFILKKIPLIKNIVP